MKSFLTVVAFFFLSTNSAFAANCPQLPSLISAPCVVAVNGNYQLAGSIDGTSVTPNGYGYRYAIEIAPGVTQAEIDCYNYRIEHNGTAWTDLGVGVGGSYNANVVVKNCRFVGAGMALCVYIDNQANWAYQNITLQGNICTATWIGFYVYSHGLKIFDNYLADIGGHVNCYTPSPQRTYGINWVGDNAEIKRNRIRGVWNRCYTEVVGISVMNGGPNFVVQDNKVENDRLYNTYTYSIAVWFGPGSWGSYVNNTVNGWHFGYLGYPPTAASVLSGTSLITDVDVPTSSMGPPLWTVTP
jgi:hypothetical protein